MNDNDARRKAALAERDEAHRAFRKAERAMDEADRARDEALRAWSEANGARKAADEKVRSIAFERLREERDALFAEARDAAVEIDARDGTHRAYDGYGSIERWRAWRAALEAALAETTKEGA